jgi:hypothetical protein
MSSLMINSRSKTSRAFMNVLAYYYDHAEEIEAIWAEERQAAAESTPNPREITAQMNAIEARFKERDPRGYEKVLEIERKYPDRDMTAPEVAEEFGISAQAVREAAANQRIPARKVGRDWIIKHQDAEQRWGKGARRKTNKSTSNSRPGAASARGVEKSTRK